MKKYIINPILIVLFLAISSISWANDWKLDANHSVIQFGVKHIFSTVWGNFSDFEGQIHFDPDKPDQSFFNFTVKVDSINTGNGKRDTHLRSDDFFSSKRFPTMHFKSSKITHTSGDHYLLTGTMTIKETRRTMELPFTYHGTAISPFNKKELVTGFDTEFTIDRLDFGVGNGKFFKMGVVDQMVKVLISVEATGQK